MGLMDTLARIPKILEANINSMLDKCEDPAKMIDQLLVDYKRDLADVKRDTVSVMADFEGAKKDLENCDKEIARLVTAAKNALTSGDEAAARQILTQKQKEATRVTLQQNYDVCLKNANMMKEGYNNLVAKISELEERKDAAKAKISLAKATQKLQDTKNIGRADKALDSFARYEEKADRMLAEANAGVELDSAGTGVDSLVEKYASAGNDVSVDAELASLKASMGIQ